MSDEAMTEYAVMWGGTSPYLMPQRTRADAERAVVDWAPLKNIHVVQRCVGPWTDTAPHPVPSAFRGT